MSFKETVERILAAGIAAEADGIAHPNSPTPDKIPPAGTTQDRIAGLNFFGGGTQGNILMITAVIVGLLGVVYLIRK